jgi:predicted phosphodiesterase
VKREAADRLLVFGDLHCDRRHLRSLVERAVEERCDALLSLGDLCYLPRHGEGRRFLRSAGALLRRAGLELLLVDGNHDDAEALATSRARTSAPRPVPLGYRLHHLPAGTRFRLGRLRCLAYGGAFPVRSPRPGRDWYRAAALERAALERLAGGGEIDLLFCHDPRTLEQGAQARGPFAALAARLRPALVLYAHQHRPQVNAARQPALVGLGSFRDGQSSAVVLDSAETGRLVRMLRDRQTAAHLEAAGPAAGTPARLGHGGAGSASRS